MIRINLLPSEYRSRDRMPLAAFAAVLGGVAVVGMTAAYYFYLQFGVLAEVRAERERMEQELASATPKLKHHAALLAEKADYEKREAKIKEIGGSRILWTKKIDQFADIVNAGEDTSRYTIWFEDLNLEQALDPKGETGGKFKSKGLSGSANYANVANFFADLEGTEFFRDFQTINNPDGKLQEPSKDLLPAQVWQFQLSMALKPTADSKKKDAKKPAAPAAPGANTPPAPESRKGGG